MYHILVVDDSKENLAIVKRELSNEYIVTPVISGAQALQFLEKKTPDIILLDLMMPDMDGKETMRRIKVNSAWQSIPVIFLTADSSPETEAECLNAGADDFIAKPFNSTVMRSRVSRIIELNVLRTDLATRLKEKTLEVENLTLNSIMAIVNAIEAKDEYTCGHSTRVADVSAAIARRLGWSEKQVQNLHYMALLHDIGKIGVPDHVLNKPTRLTDEEFAIIKEHPVKGGEILKELKFLPDIEQGALYHHERYDGKGYPHGLKGEEIPLCARIIGIADTFDAMTSNRVYRRKLTTEYVITEFKRCAGTQFDPELAKVFITMLEEGFAIQDDEQQAESITSPIFYAVSDCTDSLTGLPTEAYAKHKITELLLNGGKGALMLIGPANLGYINNSMGHLAGDNLLKMCADVLGCRISSDEILFRKGGDEFGIFFTGSTDKAQLEERCNKMLKELSECTSRTEVPDTMISAGISIDKNNFDELINAAGKAIYHAHKSMPGSLCFYDSVGRELNAGKTQIDLDKLKKIIEHENVPQAGIYNVAYDNFKELFSYISERLSSSRNSVQTILFTLKDYEGNVPETTVLDSAMRTLYEAICNCLRPADLTTQYSSSQHIVVLPSAKIENARELAHRIAEQFYKRNSSKDTILSYDFLEVCPKNTEQAVS